MYVRQLQRVGSLLISFRLLLVLNVTRIVADIESFTAPVFVGSIYVIMHPALTSEHRVLPFRLQENSRTFWYLLTILIYLI